MIVHHPLKVYRQRFTYLPPLPNVPQPNPFASLKKRAGEILVRHGVAPAVQFTQRLLSCPGLVITREKRRPKFNSESAEISAKVTRVRIAGFELPRFHHSLPHNHADGWMRDRSGQVLDALGVQITAERLKPRREQHYVRLLDLLCDRP